MSVVLKQSDILLANPPVGSSALRFKNRSEQFPIFERLLAEWIEKAIAAKVLISDEVIKEQGRNLMWELQQRVGIADIQNFEEDYTGFELSNGWLTSLLSFVFSLRTDSVLEYIRVNSYTLSKLCQGHCQHYVTSLYPVYFGYSWINKCFTITIALISL